MNVAKQALRQCKQQQQGQQMGFWFRHNKVKTASPETKRMHTDEAATKQDSPNVLQASSKVLNSVA